MGYKETCVVTFNNMFGSDFKNVKTTLIMFKIITSKANFSNSKAILFL